MLNVKTMKRLILGVSMIALLTSCEEMEPKTTQVGENTFVHNAKVFRIIDNEITELGNLKTDTITKSTVLNPRLKDYGKHDLNYVKKGASSDLTAVYRGDVLYFKMKIQGLNNLRDKYIGGGLSINFLDKYGFQIHRTNVELNELVRIVGPNNETRHFEYNGKTKMSSEVYKAISIYSVSSFLRKKRR